jgi:CheY-like chemotaxis protein
MWLRVAGFEVQTASTSLEALGLLQKRTFEVVLVDMNMPGMDGLELIRQFREWESNSIRKQKQTIHVLSAYGAFVGEKDMVRLGIEKVLDKPIDLDQLSGITPGKPTVKYSHAFDSLTTEILIKIIEITGCVAHC